MKKVGNYLIDMEKMLGSGQFGKVFLAQEIPEEAKGSNQDSVKIAECLNAENPKLLACKIIDRKSLAADKE
jgi:hypothetical protein